MIASFPDARASARQREAYTPTAGRAVIAETENPGNLATTMTRHTRSLRTAAACLLMALLAICLPAAMAAVPMLGPPAAVQTPGVITLEVFVRDGCPYCARAEEFLDRLARERRDLRVVYRNVDHDLQAMPDLVLRSRAVGVWPPGVPTFAVGPRVLAGFADERGSAPRLLALIDKGAVPVDSLRLPGLGILEAGRIGLPLFSLLAGVSDGIARCTLVLLAFPLAVLMAQRRRSRLWVLGGSFILATAACQYLLNAGWVDLTLAVNAARPARWGLGLIGVAAGLYGLLATRRLLPTVVRSRAPGDGLDTLLGLGAGVGTAVAVGIGIGAATSLAGLLCTSGNAAVLATVSSAHGLTGLTRHVHIALHAMGQAGISGALLALAVVVTGRSATGNSRSRAVPLAFMLLAVGVLLLARAAWLR
jgi:hypothetical protein